MDLLSAILPSAGLALLFWYVIRAVLRADRTEREEAARFERAAREADAARAAEGEDRGA